MNKRMFLKTSGALISGGMLSRLLPADGRQEPLKNWSGNYTYSTDRVHYPKTVEEVQHIVKNGSKLRALGTRHSFNSIADTTGDQVSTKELTGMVLNREEKTVTVGAGLKYGQLAPYLYENGFALHNLASLPHISIAGACATATHGSGIKNGNLSTAVAAFEFVDAKGDLVALSRKRDGETLPERGRGSWRLRHRDQSDSESPTHLRRQPACVRKPFVQSVGDPSR